MAHGAQCTNTTGRWAYSRMSAPTNERELMDLSPAERQALFVEMLRWRHDPTFESKVQAWLSERRNERKADRLRARHRGIPNLVVRICTKARLAPEVWEHVGDPHWGSLSLNDRRRILTALCDVIVAGVHVDPVLPEVSSRRFVACRRMRGALRNFIGFGIPSLPHLRSKQALLEAWQLEHG